MSDRSTKIKADILDSIESQINPATEETALAILAQKAGGIPANKVTDAYSFQALSDTGTYLYVFNEDGNGNWYIARYDSTTLQTSYTKGTGGYLTVYVDATHAPSGSPAWDTYDATFDNVGASSLNYDAFGNLLTTGYLKSYRDTTNSTTANLGIGGVFTGTWVALENEAQITVTVKSNRAGSLSIDRSSTGIAVGSSSVYPYTSVGTGMKVGISGQGYYRVVYTNGSLAQTTFSLNSYISTTATGFSFQQIDEPQLDNTYALNTLSVMSGKRLNDGVRAVVPLDSENNLMVTSTPYVYSISGGNVPSHDIKVKMGYTSSSTAAETTLWNPGTQYVFPAGTISVEALSSSAQDGVGGTGITVMHLEYLDINYVEKTFNFTMNGVTPVAGPTDLFRVNGFWMQSSGTGSKAAGTINLRLVGAPATIYSQTVIGETRSFNSVYTVPIGETYFVESIVFTAAYKTSGKTVRMTLHSSKRPDGVVLTTGKDFYPAFQAMLVDGISFDPAEAPKKFPEKTDIKVTVIGETNAQCTSEISGWLEI